MCTRRSIAANTTSVSEHSTKITALCAEHTNTNCQVCKMQQKHLNFLPQVEEHRSALQLLWAGFSSSMPAGPLSIHPHFSQHLQLVPRSAGLLHAPQWTHCSLLGCLAGQIFFYYKTLVHIAKISDLPLRVGKKKYKWPLTLGWEEEDTTILIYSNKYNPAKCCIKSSRYRQQQSANRAGTMQVGIPCLQMFGFYINPASETGLDQTAPPWDPPLKHCCSSSFMKCPSPSRPPPLLSAHQGSVCNATWKDWLFQLFYFPISKQPQSLLFSLTSTTFYSELPPAEVIKQFGLTPKHWKH